MRILFTKSPLSAWYGARRDAATSEGDRHNYSQEYLLGQIAILLGGRIAEETFLGSITTGASNDIERATELARAMVCEYGMSEMGR